MVHGVRSLSGLESESIIPVVVSTYFFIVACLSTPMTCSITRGAILVRMILVASTPTGLTGTYRFGTISRSGMVLRLVLRLGPPFRADRPVHRHRGRPPNT